MINIIELKDGKIKYWIGEMPAINITNNLIEEDNIQVKCDRRSANIKAALEVFLYKDASYYGLLGAEYFPSSDSDNLKIIFNYINENEEEYNDTILEYDEKVFMGLTGEYLNYTKKNIKTYISQSGKIQGGVLNFTVAANSEVGSSSKLFSVLSEMLVQLLTEVNPKEYNSDLDNVIKDIFYSSSLFVK